MRRASDTAGRPRGWLRAAGPALTLALSLALALAPAPVRAQLLEEPAAAAEDHKIEPAPPCLRRRSSGPTCFATRPSAPRSSGSGSFR